MNDVRYVKLCYSPRKSESRSGVPPLVIQERNRLRIVIRSDWDRGMSDPDREYLAELMAGWRRVASEGIHSVMDQLAELSVGPLQTLDSARVAPSELLVIVERFQADERDLGSC